MPCLDHKSVFVMPDTLQHPFLRDTLAGRCVKTACGITLDIGRQRLTGRDLKGLLDLAEEKGVLAANAAMRSGEIVNPSENRPALHTALRDPSVSAPFHTEVMKALNQVCRFAEDVRSGLFCGCRSGKRKGEQCGKRRGEKQDSVKHMRTFPGSAVDHCADGFCILYTIKYKSQMMLELYFEKNAASPGDAARRNA